MPDEHVLALSNETDTSLSRFGSEATRFSTCFLACRVSIVSCCSSIDDDNDDDDERLLVADGGVPLMEQIKSSAKSLCFFLY